MTVVHQKEYQSGDALVIPPQPNLAANQPTRPRNKGLRRPD